MMLYFENVGKHFSSAGENVTNVIFNVFLCCTYSLFIGDHYFGVTEQTVARNTDMLVFVPIVISVFTFENESRYISGIFKWQSAHTVSERPWVRVPVGP